ncbi:MAG: GNAT family N-acetyltransferase [Lachnospiraceae bacterium]|nr:GNAT family N-acetyltransferase [Lachnospiraceae bacterium]
MIRIAEEKDIDRILELLIQVNNVHADIRPDLFIHNRTKYTRESLRAILSDEMSPIFVAVDENDSVIGYGFTKVEKHGGEPNIQEYVSLYIDDICVDEKHRGKKVATEIYRFIEGFAAAMGFYNITLNVWEGNEGAKRFYEAMNMKVLKTTMEKVV